mgnify:CR=1 FL=1
MLLSHYVQQVMSNVCLLFSAALPSCLIIRSCTVRSRCRWQKIRRASRRPPWYVQITLVHSPRHVLLQKTVNRRSLLALVMCLWQSRWRTRNEPPLAHGKVTVYPRITSDTYSACFTQLRDQLRLWRNETLPPATVCWPSARGSVVTSDSYVDVVSISAFD